LKKTYRLGWFSTGRDKAARDLLTVAQRSIALGEIEAEIAFVFCNRKPGEARESDLFLELAESYGLPLAAFSSKDFKTSQPRLSAPWRISYDREVMKRLEGFDADLCVLAGYMLIVGEEMCRRYNMINLHREIEGQPVVEIKQKHGENNRLFKAIRQHGLAREFPLIIATLKAFSQGRVKIEGGRVVDADGKPIKGYNLTEEIDKLVR